MLLPTKSNGKGKEREDVVKREKVGPVTNNKAPVKKPMEEEDSFSKKEISAEEATEFLRIIQHLVHEVLAWERLLRFLWTMVLLSLSCLKQH